MGLDRRAWRGSAAVAIVLAVFLPGCRNAPAPHAHGSHSEILLLHEPGTLENAAARLRTALRAPVVYLGRAEPRFEVRVQQQPPRDDDLAARNLVLLVLLDAGGALDGLVRRVFPSDDLTRARRDGAALFTYTDVWAHDQVVAVVAAARGSALDSLLHRVLPRFAADYERTVVARWTKALRAEHSRAPQSDTPQAEVVFDIAVPAAYRPVERADGWKDAVGWVRDSPTRIVTVLWLDDVDSTQAHSSAFLRGVQRDALWRMHEDTLVEEQSDFDRTGGQLYFVGVWQNQREVAGGPLITRFVHEPAARRLFAIQGLLFAPGRPKHPFVRELRAVLGTFTIEGPA